MSVEPIARVQQQHRPFRAFNPGGAHEEWINCQTAGAVDHCLLRLDPQPGESILEIATGAGATAERLALGGAHVAATDTRKDRIDIARQFNASRDVDYWVSSPESLPFPDASFDGIVCAFGVGQISDPRLAADELARVTKSGGRIALATWSPWDGASEMFEMIQSLGLPRMTTSDALFDWGQSWWLEQLFNDYFALGFEVGTAPYRVGDLRSAWSDFLHRKESNVALFEAAYTDVRSEFEAFHERYRTDMGIQIPRTYLVTLGRRD